MRQPCDFLVYLVEHSWRPADMTTVFGNAAFGDKADNKCSTRAFPLMTHMYGPAMVDLADVRSCINVSGLCSERVVLRAIMDISARAISLAAGPQWTIRVISEVVRALQGPTDCSS